MWAKAAQMWESGEHFAPQALRLAQRLNQLSWSSFGQKDGDRGD